MKTYRVLGVSASPSTLQTWMETPEVVRLQQIEGWYPRWRPGTWFGTCFHRINELSKPGEWEETARKLWEDKCDEVKAKAGRSAKIKKAEVECLTAGRMCRLYYEHHSGDQWNWMAKELRLDCEYSVCVDGVHYLIPLKGYIDGIVTKGKGTGGVWIFDSKTRAQIKKERSAVMVEYDLQMQFYRWVLGTIGFEKEGKKVKKQVMGIIYDQIKKPGHKWEGMEIDAYLDKVEGAVRKDFDSFFVRWQQSIPQTDSEEWRSKFFDGLMHNYARWLLGFFRQGKHGFELIENPFDNPIHHVGKLVSMYGPSDYVGLITKEDKKNMDRIDRQPIRFEEVNGYA